MFLKQASLSLIIYLGVKQGHHRHHKEYKLKTSFFHITTSGTGLACYSEYHLRPNSAFFCIWIEAVIYKLWAPYSALWAFLVFVGFLLFSFGIISKSILT